MMHYGNEMVLNKKPCITTSCVEFAGSLDWSCLTGATRNRLDNHRLQSPLPLIPFNSWGCLHTLRWSRISRVIQVLLPPLPYPKTTSRGHSRPEDYTHVLNEATGLRLGFSILNILKNYLIVHCLYVHYVHKVTVLFFLFNIFFE